MEFEANPGKIRVLGLKRRIFTDLSTHKRRSSLEQNHTLRRWTL